MGYSKTFAISNSLKSETSEHYLRKANKTDIHVPWILSLNLNQTRGVLHCAVCKIKP